MKPRREVSQLSLQGFERREGTQAGVRKPDVSENSDLLGRTFSDGTSDVRVTGLSATNPAHVVVERERDGHSWTIHAGVVRMIVGRVRRKHAA